MVCYLTFCEIESPSFWSFLFMCKKFLKGRYSFWTAMWKKSAFDSFSFQFLSHILPSEALCPSISIISQAYCLNVVRLLQSGQTSFMALQVGFQKLLSKRSFLLTTILWFSFVDGTSYKEHILKGGKKAPKWMLSQKCSCFFITLQRNWI